MKKIFILAFIVLSCSKKPFVEPRDKSFTLKVTTSEGGSVDPTEGTYTESTTVTITATPEQGYAFTGWSGNVRGYSNPLSFTITGNSNIKATQHEGYVLERYLL